MQSPSLPRYRLAPRQNTIWRLQQASNAGRVEAALGLEGELDIPALRAAVEQVVARHEILRTSFQLSPGMNLPLQVVAPAGVPDWREVDVTGRERTATVGALIEATFAAEQPAAFDLKSGPVLRLTLLRLGLRHHALLLSLPALCADAWTAQRLVEEISRRYGQSAHAEEAAPMQYADYAAWHHALLEDPDAAAGREFWRTLDLEGLANVRLPLEKTITAAGPFTPHVFSTPVEPAVAALALAQGGAWGVPASAVFLGAWQVLLGRLSGQGDLPVGVLHDGRSYAEMEEAFGPFAVMLPVRAALAAADSFGDALKSLSRALEQARAAQDSWAEEVTGAGIPYAFEFAELPATRTERGVSITLLRQQACGSRFRVKLAVTRAGDEWRADFHYDPAGFHPDTIERLAGQFHSILTNAVTQPGTRVGELDILSAAERARILSEFNPTEAAFPRECCLHELIETQAARTPSQAAVVCGEQQLTYGELNARANQLARHLQTLGVGPEVLVGLCVGRSVEMVVGILAILKAGGAWLPLDPAYPKERLAFMLASAHAPVLLTQTSLVGGLPPHTARVVTLDGDWPAIATQPESNLPPAAAPHHLAYVIYTSGSTGQPKGVMITHANLANYVQALPGPLGLTAQARYLHTASISFSSSVRQFAVPLAQGATVVLATGEQIREPLKLFAEIKRQRVTVIDLVPSYWRSCTQALSALAPPARAELLDNALELILSASEPLHSDLPHLWRSSFQHRARIVNMFGQTETTGIVTLFPILEVTDARARVVPIGRPIANAQAYVLDAQLRPVPIGMSGDLYLAGTGLGRGYLNQPELTAEKFIRHPFSPDPQARVYKTGDQARYLPDGTLEFLGRGDSQVKIRGFRIEPGEIEAALGMHPAVREVVVVAREEGTGDRRLVAYVVARDGMAAGVTGLRQFLTERLPDYMVPSALVLLPALPRTPNGKVDRRALPAPNRERPALDKPFVAPATETEAALAAIWSELLRLEPVGAQDNFFELGGQSLLGTQLLSRVRDSFQVELSWRHFFEAPTVAAMAERVDTIRWARRGASAITTGAAADQIEGEI